MDLADLPITPVNSSGLLRMLHRALPLERRYLPLLRAYRKEAGLLSVPWGEFQLHFPGPWLATACDAVYKEPQSNNPEFFELLAPAMATLDSGCIVDVGAALGVYVLNFRALTDRRIIAYEPSPLPFALVEYNIRANSLADVQLRNVACGDFQGWIQLSAGINGFVRSERHGADAPEGDAAAGFDMAEDVLGKTVSVPLVRLDDDLRSAEAVSLLKIDCEGFEYQVLAGSAELIEKYHPVIFVELHPQQIGNYGHSLADICEFLAGRYELEFWDYRESERSTHSLVRLFGRYRHNGRRFPSQRAMLETAARPSAPGQIFLLARPR